MGEPFQQTVLLVDDEATVRTFVKSVLECEGFQVFEAADGVDALVLLRSLGRTVDLLLTDVKMPRMTGAELAQAVRSEYPGTPIVYISGERLESELHKPLRRMVFLPKPFRLRNLLDAVRSVLPAPGQHIGARDLTMAGRGESNRLLKGMN